MTQQIQKTHRWAETVRQGRGSTPNPANQPIFFFDGESPHTLQALSCGRHHVEARRLPGQAEGGAYDPNPENRMTGKTEASRGKDRAPKKGATDE
jgi:hypothetical protein